MNIKMIAVIKVGGHQEIVKVGDTISVDKIDLEIGKNTNFETLLVSEEDGKGFKIGTPFLSDIKVEAKITAHGKGDKITVFKMKPRKRYRRTQGHRQDFTVIEIIKIGGSAKTVKTTKKVEEKIIAKKDKTTESKKVVKKSTKKPTTAKKTTSKK